MPKMLVVDDDVTLATMLVKQMSAQGHSAEMAWTLTEGLAKAAAAPFDIILLDVQLPDGNGLEHLPQFKTTPSLPEVIIITGHGEADGAEKAIVSGAWSYIEKPHVIRELHLHLTRALQYRREKLKVNEVPVSLKRDKIIGNSAALNKCLDQLARAAACDVSVLITGESGTGKELFAGAIHENSRRSQGNFVVVDCAALPETLIESTLFGHVKGAFTGADTAQDGLVKHADGGTLFLDEVGELPLAIQKTFLRLLQEQEYRPVGSTRRQHSNFRLVAATNRNLEERTAANLFREDLLFRLQAFAIELPPLRDRLEDVEKLATSFIARLCRRYGLETKGISQDFIDALTSYHWPGNVRELHQTIEQVFTSAFLGPTCFAIHLPEQFRIKQARAGLSSAGKPDSQETTLPNWRRYKDMCEESYLHKLRLLAEGNVSKACRISGISRTRLYQLINKFGMDFS
ncbi:MAG: sigma-54 dependent transcriptional regulator [Desulfopila sp.]|jgi:two-component system NtrC family response regulator|nr:sigma-54 dependent transcriptional regulator [Desulfopila sp.]